MMNQTNVGHTLFTKTNSINNFEHIVILSDKEWFTYNRSQKYQNNTTIDSVAFNY